MKKNVDFVAYMPQRESSWGFIIKGNAHELSEVYYETLDITKILFNIINDFFIPTNIEYRGNESKNMSLNDYFNYFKNNYKSIKFFDKKIIFESGITYEEFLKDINNIKFSNDRVIIINRIGISGKTKFILMNNDIYIDNHTSRELYAGWDDEEGLLVGSTFDPLTINIFHSSTKDKNSNTAYYDIVFRSYTDMWFERSEFGLANRNRLRSVFNSIYNNFNVTDLYLHGNMLPDDWLKNVVFGKD